MERKRIHKNLKTQELRQLRVADREAWIEKERAGDEVNSLALVAETGDLDTQTCGAGRSCEGPIVTNMI